MRYLLDTNVLSEPVRRQPDPGVITQLDRHSGATCTAAIVLHELRYGCARLPEGAPKRTLQRYLDQVVARLDVLGYDEPAALWHASVRARLETGGRSTSFAGAQIAAIAAVHDLAVVTRNVQHFEPLDVQVVSWHTGSSGG